MTDEGKLNDQKSRGERARRLLDDDFIKGAFDIVRESIMEAWASAEPGDREGQQRLHDMLCGLSDVRQQFDHAVTTGRLAEIELNRNRDTDG